MDRNDDLVDIDGHPRTSIITDPGDGQLPFTAEGKRLSDAAKAPDFNAYDNPEERSASERCIASPSQAGPPMMSGPDDANYQIVQTRDRVGLLSEMIHDVRVVRIGGSHPQALLHPFRVTPSATGKAILSSSRPWIKAPRHRFARSAARPS